MSEHRRDRGCAVLWKTQRLRADVLKSAESQERLAMVSGRRRETGAVDPGNRMDLRGAVLESVYLQLQYNLEVRGNFSLQNSQGN
jgi:hypothetical protein